MAQEELDANVLESLAAKIDGLDLSAQEGSVIKAVLARATRADAQVQGFGGVFEIETTFKLTGDSRLTHNAVGWGHALGFQIHTSADRFIGETEKN